MFQVGQKVVCVNDQDCKLPGLWAPWENPLQKGEVYTISAVGLIHQHDPYKLPCVLVAEVWRPEQCPFWAHRFRPLVEDKKKVATFIPTPIPRRVKKREDA